MFDMSEIQDDVEENLYSSAKEETDSGDTNYEEVMSVRSKEAGHSNNEYSNIFLYFFCIYDWYSFLFEYS